MITPRRARTTVLLLVAAALAPAPPAFAQFAGVVERMSQSSTGEEGNEGGTLPSVSEDGRFVAFQSSSTNLVPGDTNDNTDIFVHDHQTGVVQRVSVAWNGMEARDDSRCPAISADGRHVAFLSRAWNMYPGGANLGRPRWDVYVHDRWTGTTTPVSRGYDGGEPTNESYCPSISAGGRRVAFASRASNLVKHDENNQDDVFLYDLDKQKMKLISKAADGRSGNWRSFGGKISADGSAVAFMSHATNLDGAALPPASGVYSRALVRDLAAGTTEVLDVTPQLPSLLPNGSTTEMAISADGRRVAFLSWATNLVSPPPPSARFDNIYLRDRDAGRTSLVTYQDTLYDDCDPGPGVFRCDDGSNLAPAISGDGRYVSFASYSRRLLPMSLNGSPQVYLYDTLGGRLRRVSVDEYGQEGGCSSDSSLSYDGKILTIGSDGGIVPQANGRRDVYRQEWQCVPGGICRPEVACPPKPTTCATTGNAVFRLRKHPPGGRHEDRLFFRWHGSAEERPLPDPFDDRARYQLCVYGGPLGAVAMDVGLPEADACAGGGPCWKQRGRLTRLRDPNGGIASLTLFGGDTATRIQASGKGALLDAPYLPLTGTQGLTVQLQDRDSGRCWSADFPAAAVRKNFAGKPGYGSRDDGWLVARLP
jgi:Tol biopolymer transport system component